MGVNDFVHVGQKAASGLTEQEEKLLNDFCSLSDEQKIRVVAYLGDTLDSSGNLGVMLRSEADKIVKKEKGKSYYSAERKEERKKVLEHTSELRDMTKYQTDEVSGDPDEDRNRPGYQPKGLFKNLFKK